MILVFWMLSFKPDFSLSYFTFIKRLFSSSSLSAIRVVSSAYLTLLIFLLGILIPACDLSSLEFHMMYYTNKLNKQSDSIHPWHTPSWIWNQCCSMSTSNCCFLTCVWISQEAVRWSGIPITSRIFHRVVIHRVKSFSIASKAEVDVFQEFSCFFYGPVDVGNLISGSSAFAKTDRKSVV